MVVTGVTIEQIAEVALAGGSRLLRGMTMALLRENSDLSQIPRPKTDDPLILAAAASLIELFAQRRGQSPPEWTKEIGPLPKPIYLVKGIGKETTKNIRRLADAQSPEPLRKRGFLAPANYLTFV
jgi:hypothetical protein